MAGELLLLIATSKKKKEPEIIPAPSPTPVPTPSPAPVPDTPVQPQPAAPAPVLPPVHAKKTIRLDSNTNLVVDANSYYARWVYEPIDNVGEFKQLMDTRGVEHHNVAIPGQTWDTMRSSMDDVLELFRPNKYNVLVCGESRNYAFFHAGTTSQQLVEKCSKYITTVQAKTKKRYGKGWDAIVVCGTIPSDGAPSPGYDAQYVKNTNLALMEFDKTIEADPSLVDAVGFVNFRKSSPQYFSGDGTTLTGFMTNQDTRMEKAPPYVHPIGAARDAFAKAIADELKRLADIK